MSQYHRIAAITLITSGAVLAFVFLAIGCNPTTQSTKPATTSTDNDGRTCASCHTNKDKLTSLARPATPGAASALYGQPATVSRADERLLVSQDFLNSTHGKIACQACHGGRASDDLNSAHQGLVKDPSLERLDVCAACHKDIVAAYNNALHNTLQGQTNALRARSLDGIIPSAIGKSVDQTCSTCHTTCGQCHVSRPNAGQGGLLKGHQFVKKPPVQQTCTQCHSTSTAAQDYYGGLSNPGDVHWTRAKLECTDCHGKKELHGEGGTYRDAGEVREMPRCTDCHVSADLSKRVEHNIHREKATCYVCHASTPVNSCSGCHVAADGAATFTRSTAFKIGLNALPDARHPEKYATVSHVPVLADSYSRLGAKLEGFDDVPTWKRTAPHSIQRVTPQNKTCASCHGQRKLFLTEDDLKLGDSRADIKVVVPVVPPRF